MGLQGALRPHAAIHPGFLLLRVTLYLYGVDCFNEKENICRVNGRTIPINHPWSQAPNVAIKGFVGLFPSLILSLTATGLQTRDLLWINHVVPWLLWNPANSRVKQRRGVAPILLLVIPQVK